jgi:hypothetical protein
MGSRVQRIVIALLVKMGYGGSRVDSAIFRNSRTDVDQFGQDNLAVPDDLSDAVLHGGSSKRQDRMRSRIEHSRYTKNPKFSIPTVFYGKFKRSTFGVRH